MFNQPSKYLTIKFLTLCLLLTGTVEANGPPIRVEQAIPSVAEQGQQQLHVKIRGKGFKPGDLVRFLVADTDNDEEINVLTVTYDESTGDLDTVITVDEDAEISNYDIEVYRSGRGGKGTDLFSVLEQNTGSGNSSLSAEFCLYLTNLVPGLAPDDTDVYCDNKRQKVKVATGSGPGFRFDTNTSKNSPKRTVTLNVSGGGVDIYDNANNYLNTLFTGDYDIGLRFNKTNGGLDLGAMNINEVGYVPVDIQVTSPDGSNSYGLAFGENSKPFSHGDLTDNPCVRNNTLDARVERMSASMWSIESNRNNDKACLWNNPTAGLADQEGTVVKMPFHFVIEIK